MNLVARQRRDVLPRIEGRGVGEERLAEVISTHAEASATSAKIICDHLDVAGAVADRHGWGPKEDLHRYLKAGREALVWKLDGLSEYEIRRPMVPTGTNLLGLVKHVAGVEVGYFGACFDRPFPEPLPWFEDGAEPNSDMWATADESREQIVDLYQRAWAHSDGTIGRLALDATGSVPWWPEDRRDVTLHCILVHVIAETARHAGHADIVRELIDGAAGLRQGNDNMAPGDTAWWESYRSRLETAAKDAEQRHGSAPDGGRGHIRRRTRP